ncbi:MAG: hypothetical protein ACJ04O_08615, partial [Cellvibrionales bacterium]
LNVIADIDAVNNIPNFAFVLFMLEPLNLLVWLLLFALVRKIAQITSKRRIFLLGFSASVHTFQTMYTKKLNFVN